MSGNTSEVDPESSPVPSLLRTVSVHGGLLLLTLATTTLAGVQWLNKDPLELSNFPAGLPYGVLIVIMLGSHELGHYIAARRWNVQATLPYFLPFPSFVGVFPVGTVGAVIRVKSRITSREALFDIGVAGPIAGFVTSAAILAIGYATLPPIEYLYSIHPEYAQLASIPMEGLRFGNSLFFDLTGHLVVDAGQFVPPMNEVYHYPFLCVGWFGFFVTAMNLIPVGQLDGGHIAYSMFGNMALRISQVALVVLAIIGLLGFVPLLGIDFELGWTGWLFWAIVLMAFHRFRFFKHPTLEYPKLNGRRMVLGWVCWAIFLGCFSLAPFTLLGM